MTWWARILRRNRLDRQLDAELRDHIERQVADAVRAGATEDEARREATLAFGGVEQMKEECRDVRGTRWLDETVQDLRHGARVLRQSPALTAVAVLSLALGIGANTAIFSLVDSLLLKTLPVRDPDGLVLLDRGSWTYPIWEQVHAREHELFDGAMAWSTQSFSLTQGGEAQTVDGMFVSGGFFEVLGVPVVLGRTLTPDDDRRGGGRDGAVTVISYPFWQERFGGAADAIGRAITMDGVPFTIVGVAPAGFFGPVVGGSFDVLVPFGTEPLVLGRESALDKRSTWWLEIAARMKPGQTPDTVTQAFRAIQPQIREATIPGSMSQADRPQYLRDGLTWISAARGKSSLRGRYQRPLLTIMVVVALVLLIACGNIANLLLARASARRHEMSMRLALGASRWRLARQLLTESLLLAGVGAVLSLAFAHWGSRLLLRQLSSTGRPVMLDVSLDWRVLAFTAAVTIVTAILFGMAPAFRAGRVELTDVLKEQGRGLAGDGRRALSQPLVVAQVALSLVLVAAAGLFIRTFSTLATLDLGFDRDPVLLVRMDTMRTSTTPDQRATFFERATQAVTALPGVAGAGVSIISPVSGAGWNHLLDIPERAHLSKRERMTFINAVTPGWFATYGTTLRAGRDFTDRDRAGTPEVIIVNETFRKKFFGDANPVGQILSGYERPRLIVGLVEDAAYSSVRGAVPPVVFVPLLQVAPENVGPRATMSVRAAAGAPALLIRSITAALGEVDSRLSLSFRPLIDQVNASFLQERVIAMLSGFFGALALLLAGIGLHGIASAAVLRRRTEIAVRMTLGASAASVVRGLLTRIAILVAIGVLIGTGISLWALRFISTLLYDVTPRDPVTLIGAAMVLAAIGLLATWWPARRAARIEPAQVLREG